MSFRIPAIGRSALAATVIAAACSAPPTPPTLLSELSPRSLGLYAGHVVPTADESRWREIPWLPTFAEGMRAAGQQQRPLLFWAMNGHPLGCT